MLFLRPGQFSRASSGVSQTVPPVITEPTVEERQRKMVRGMWEDHYEGHRVLTIREDGTALMVVELAGVGAFLFGPRLEFDIDWQLINGRVILHTNGGRPEKKARAILSLHTDHAEYYLDDLNEGHLVLRDMKSAKKFEWKRVLETAAKVVPTTSPTPVN